MNKPGNTPGPYHGGDLAEARARWGEPAGGWLDLSTGINPNPYPDVAVALESVTRLPQSERSEALLAAAAKAYGAPADAVAVAAPGTQAVLQALPHLFDPRPVRVAGFTYAEHALLWRDAGHEVEVVDGLEDMGGAEVCVVVNPNNPDGRMYPPERLLAAARALAAKGGVLVVDEAFADVAPEASLVPHLGGGVAAIVLRSFGKFFGLAGVRLGFAIGPAGLIGRLGRRLGPWAVAGPALEIGARALGDTAWIAATRKELTTRRRRLDGVLAAAGLEVVGGTDLFRLARHADAQEIYQRLGRAGVFVRRFPEQPRHLRFGLPGDDTAFERLAAALAAE